MFAAPPRTRFFPRHNLNLRLRREVRDEATDTWLDCVGMRDRGAAISRAPRRLVRPRSPSRKRRQPRLLTGLSLTPAIRPPLLASPSSTVHRQNRPRWCPTTRKRRRTPSIQTWKLAASARGYWLQCDVCEHHGADLAQVARGGHAMRRHFRAQHALRRRGSARNQERRLQIVNSPIDSTDYSLSSMSRCTE